jgi:hypothetical protein
MWKIGLRTQTSQQIELISIASLLSAKAALPTAKVRLSRLYHIALVPRC